MAEQTTPHHGGAFNAGGGWVGLCTCGWRGVSRLSQEDALVDASAHRLAALTPAQEASDG